MATNQSFVYCWTDTITGMLYIGSHKGAPDDGYVCSSNRMIVEYKKRPETFKRQIVAQGEYNDIRALEAALLKSAGAAEDPTYYNLHNCDEAFYSDTSKKYCIEGKTYVGMRSIMEDYGLKSYASVYSRIRSTSKKFEHWNYFGCTKQTKTVKRPDLAERNKLGHSEESKKKMSGPRSSVVGEKNPMWGKTHSADAREKIREKATGRNKKPVTEETRKKMSDARQNFWLKRKDQTHADE